jgi:D-3-phosphoglycerate dehydrogenase
MALVERRGASENAADGRSEEANRMSALFLDCTDDLKPLWQRVHGPTDPPIAVNMASGQPEDVAALLRGYSICIDDHTYFNDELLGRCSDLRRIVFLGTGASSFIDLAAAERRGIAVDTIKGYGDTTVAEHTIALAMAASRSVARMDREIRAGEWRQVEGVQLLGKTMGIIGFGGIGREVARIARGIGMAVLAWNRSAVADPPVPMVALDEVLGKADILSVHLSLNEKTRGFLDQEKLGRTKPGVILVNTARADVVDAAALVALLQSGHIRHAAIDVFAQEPPSRNDKLLSLENVTLSSHSGFMTPEASMTMLRRAVELVAAAER